MIKDRNYQIFHRYMEINRYRYNQNLFLNDTMYFCKVWKSHRHGFREKCKKHDCEAVFIALNQRCIDYELHILKVKYEAGQLTDVEYRTKEKEIERYYG